MKNQKNRGITLIALVITIVVLVMLVGVSVSVAINTGLIANSKKAVADYDEAQIGEKAEIKKVEDIINSMDPNSLAAKVKVGDYVEYTPVAGTTYTSVTGSYDGDITTIDVEGQPTVGGTQGNGYGDQTFTVPADTSAIKWRVIGIENGKVNLVSEVDEGGIGRSGVISANNENGEEYFYLQGLTGVVYGDEELDAVCSIYGTGKGAEGARSIEVADFDKLTGYDVTKDPNYKDQYGKIVELEDGTRYRNTYYEYYPMEYLSDDLKGLVNNEVFVEGMEESEVFYPGFLISPVCFFGDGTEYSENCFTIATVYEDISNRAYYLFAYSIGDSYASWSEGLCSELVRPVVTLKSDLKVASDSGDGSADSPWKFE